MHVVIISIVGFNGQKCPCPNMKCQPFNLNTFGAQAFKNIKREMQPCRGRGNRGCFAIGKDGLVVGNILCIYLAFTSDIGR